MLVWITHLKYLLLNRNTIFVPKCFYYAVRIYLPTFNIQQMGACKLRQWQKLGKIEFMYLGNDVNSASEESQVTETVYTIQSIYIRIRTTQYTEYN